MIAVSRSSRRRPLVERIEHDEHRAEVRAVGLLHEGIAGHGDRVGHAGRVAGDLVDLRPALLGPLQRGGVGQLDADDDPALVLLRDEARRGLAEDPVGQAPASAA